MVKKTTTVIILFIVFLSVFSLRYIHSAECDDKTGNDKITCLEQVLTQLNQQKSTLASQIQYMDTQISLTTLQINQTEQKIESTGKEIEQLGSRIEGLDQSLDYLSKQLIQRIVVGYKKKPLSVISLLLDSQGASDFLNQVKYLKSAQNNNQKLIYTVQETKSNAEEQKKLREDKKVELDKLNETLNYQKQSLSSQKAQKQRLLADTQNDEQIYQNLLANARAEYSAIQGIIAGSGTESKIREVKKGDTIASLISGSSCNSSGEHLHFIVQQNNNVVNPFNFLKSVDSRNCSGSSCDSGDGDSFSPSGNLDWPLSPTITFSQGYGSTWAVRNTWVGRIYSFHNGIDIKGSSSNVTAIADGTLYRGSYAVGCTLSYVKLVHNESGLTTLYLHVYPQ